MQTQHLFLRNNTYYYLARIPKDLLCQFPVKTVWRSLKTSSMTAAKVRLKDFEYRAEMLYMQIRTGTLSDEQVTRLVAEFLHGELSAAENDRESAHNFRQKITTSGGIDVLAGAYNEVAKAIQNNLAASSLEYAEIIAAAIIEKNKLPVADGSEDFIRLAREIAKAEIRRLGIEAARTQGDYDSNLERSLLQKYPRPISKGLKLSELVEKYTEDRITEKFGRFNFIRY